MKHSGAQGIFLWHYTMMNVFGYHISWKVILQAIGLILVTVVLILLMDSVDDSTDMAGNILSDDSLKSYIEYYDERGMERYKSNLSL